MRMRTILLMLAPALLADMPAQNRIPIGLTSAGTAIEAIVAAGDGPTVLVIGGMDGAAIQPAPPVRGLRLLTIPLANPTKAPLSFPPAGTAYRENGESHYLWRWIGTSAPDLVVI